MLHVSTHDTECEQRVSISTDESRNDGVERSLASVDLIGMSRFERKPGSAVLQCNARTVNDDPGSKPHVV